MLLSCLSEDVTKRFYGIRDIKLPQDFHSKSEIDIFVQKNLKLSIVLLIATEQENW